MVLTAKLKNEQEITFQKYQIAFLLKGSQRNTATLALEPFENENYMREFTLTDDAEYERLKKIWIDSRNKKEEE